jgi:HrpA-like RNA helicase
MARVPRYEPDIGLTRLETVRAARAAVDQRRGRAGRTEPGICYRLWDEPQTASLTAFTQPEILSADLSSLVLDLAQWGVNDPATLAFLDPPPVPALKEARSLLRELGALDADGRITAEGKSLRALALPPRLARMMPLYSPSAGSAATASISISGSTNSAATVRNAPQVRAASPSAGPHRWRPRRVLFLLPPPLRGPRRAKLALEVGERGPQRRSEFGAPPSPTPQSGSLRPSRPGKG